MRVEDKSHVSSFHLGWVYLPIEKVASPIEFCVRPATVASTYTTRPRVCFDLHNSFRCETITILALFTHARLA